MNTKKQFEQFYGTQQYFPYNNYAYTDGMNYLLQFLDDEDKKELLNNICNTTSFLYPFTSTTLKVTKDSITVNITDGNGKKLVTFDLNKPEKLDTGLYKIFCYNYVIMAASEY